MDAEPYEFKPGGVVSGSDRVRVYREHIVPLHKAIQPGYCPYCDPEIPDEWHACPIHRDGDG